MAAGAGRVAAAGGLHDAFAPEPRTAEPPVSAWGGGRTLRGGSGRAVLGRVFARPGASQILAPCPVTCKRKIGGLCAGSLRGSGHPKPRWGLLVFAYRVVVETEEQSRVYVVPGRDLADAARAAQDQLDDGSRLLALEEIAELLGWGGESSEAPVADTAGEPETPPATASADEPHDDTQPAPIPRQGTRRDQLLELLGQHTEPLHTTVIAEALRITRGHAAQVAREAVKAGLVERVGVRTGKVRLVPEPASSPPPARAPQHDAPAVAGAATPASKKQGLSRGEQLVAALRARGGEAHITELASDLDTNRGNAENVVRAAAKAGLVERVGRRTGRIRLSQSAAMGKAPQEQPGAAVDPAELAGIQRRVWSVVSERRTWSTAREVASELGCRPREAGNALALLVDGGLVDRQPGDRTPDSPALYRAR